MSSGVEPFAVAAGQLVVGSASELEFADAGWPHPQVGGGGGEGEVLGAPGRSQVGVVWGGSLPGEGVEDLPSHSSFEGGRLPCWSIPWPCDCCGRRGSRARRTG